MFSDKYIENLATNKERQQIMDLWKDLDEAKVSETKKEFERIPDGDYLATITDVEIKEDLFQVAISVEFTIDEGDFKNRKLWYSSIINEELKEKYPERLGYIKQAICKMAGVNTTDGKPMEILAGVKGNRCEVHVKNNPSKKDPTKIYSNVYVNNRVS